MYRTRKATKTYNPDASQKLYQSRQLACPFCELDDRTVHRDGRYTRVVDNLYPYDYWDGHLVVEHVLLLPKRHVESLQELRDAEKLETVRIMAEYEAAGYSVYWRSQANAARSVPHQHTHLIKTGGSPARFSLYLRRPYLMWRA